jgi:hypothetical protein
VAKPQDEERVEEFVSGGRREKQHRDIHGKAEYRSHWLKFYSLMFKVASILNFFRKSLFDSGINEWFIYHSLPL